MEYPEFLKWLHNLKEANAKHTALLALIDKTCHSLSKTNTRQAQKTIIDLLKKIIAIDAKLENRVIYPNPQETAGTILEALSKPSQVALFESSYKFFNLKAVLEKYREHLNQVLEAHAEIYFPYKKTILTELRDSSQLQEYPEIALAIEKIKSVEGYLKIFNDEEKNFGEKLSTFKAAYFKDINHETGKHLFEKRRDTTGMIIAKLFASLFIIPIFFVWKVKGQEVDRDIQQISDFSLPKPG